MTSKYLRLSSCGTALIPGTLTKPAGQLCSVLRIVCDRFQSDTVYLTYGSAMRRSVSLIILFGKAMISKWRALMSQRLGSKTIL